MEKEASWACIQATNVQVNANMHPFVFCVLNARPQSEKVA